MSNKPLGDTSDDENASSDGTEEARLALAAATRRVLNAVRVTAITGDPAADAVALLDRAAELAESKQMEGLHAQGVMGDLVGGFDSGDPMEFFPYSPIIGRLHPASPPVEFWVEGEEVHGRMNLSAVYAGPPGLVHGGVIAEIFDELLGTVNVVMGRGGYTGSLNVRYQRPTPLMKEISMRGLARWPRGAKALHGWRDGLRRRGHRQSRGDLYSCQSPAR